MRKIRTRGEEGEKNEEEGRGDKEVEGEAEGKWRE